MILSEIRRELAREPLRAALTLIGIVIGSASIVFLASALSSAQIALARMDQDASGDDISLVETHSPPGPLAASKTTRALTLRDITPLQNTESVSRIGGSNILYHQEATAGGKRMFVGVQSGGTNYAQLSELKVEHGRWPSDAEETERLCVIGHDVWKNLFGGLWPLPSNVLLLNGGATLRVVGVLLPRPPLGGGGGDGTWMFDRKVWVSSTVYARSLVDSNKDVAEIGMRHPLDGDAMPDLAKLASHMTRVLENVHFGVRNFEFDALNKGFQTWELITFALGAIMFACGLVSMIVGGVNVMNAQLVSLAEKTKEYGVRRALGATAADLRRAVLIESSLYSLCGGVFGMLLGQALAWGLSVLLTATWAPWPLRVIPWSLFVALGASAAVGIFAGLLPALRASQLLPSECLREE